MFVGTVRVFCYSEQQVLHCDLIPGLCLLQRPSELQVLADLGHCRPSIRLLAQRAEQATAGFSGILALDSGPARWRILHDTPSEHGHVVLQAAGR
jgi:hypothetical protein